MLLPMVQLVFAAIGCCSYILWINKSSCR